MTYADTITLLLCLFVVLLALHGAKLHGAVAVGLPASADAPSSSTLLQTAIVVAPFRELAGMPRPPEDADDDTADRATHQDNLPTRRAVVATGSHPPTGSSIRRTPSLMPEPCRRAFCAQSGPGRSPASPGRGTAPAIQRRLAAA